MVWNNNTGGKHTRIKEQGDNVSFCPDTDKFQWSCRVHSGLMRCSRLNILALPESNAVYCTDATQTYGTCDGSTCTWTWDWTLPLKTLSASRVCVKGFQPFSFVRQFNEENNGQGMPIIAMSSLLRGMLSNWGELTLTRTQQSTKLPTANFHALHQHEPYSHNVYCILYIRSVTYCQKLTVHSWNSQ